MQSSGSSLRRSRLTRMSTARVCSSASWPRRRLRISSRSKTFCGSRASSTSSSNSVPVSSTGWPRRCTCAARQVDRAGRRRRSAGASAAGAAARAAQDGLQPRHQLARLEGLGQVVVGAELQADDAVHDLAARGEHDDRQVALLADGAAQLEAVHLGQHHVEDGGVEAALRAAAPGPALGRVALLQLHVEALQVGRQRRRQQLVVVDQQDAVHGRHARMRRSRSQRRFRTRQPPRPRLSMNSRSFGLLLGLQAVVEVGQRVDRAPGCRRGWRWSSRRPAPARAPCRSARR